MNYEMSEERITEDRLEKAKRKRRNNTISSILVMFGCLIVLVLVTYLAGVLYMWIDSEFQKNVDTMEQAVSIQEQTELITYTQQELDEAVQAAKAQLKEEAYAEALNAIKEKMQSGESIIETLRQVYEDDIVLASDGRIHYIPINLELKLNGYTMNNLNILENGEYQYLDGGQVVSYKGIDVSKHQGKIDWQQVAEDGVEFAFIRVGFRGYGSGKLVEDEYFEQNIEGAIDAGIKVGVYFYTQAVTEAEALEEAQFVLEKIAPYKVDCPIVFDVERVTGDEGRMNELTPEERTNMTLQFCQTIENAGYKPMVYHNMEMAALMLELQPLEKYDKWFAYYSQDMYYPYAYKIWQYSDKGTVNGIKGPVDLNISFEPLWEE